MSGGQDVEEGHTHTHAHLQIRSQGGRRSTDRSETSKIEEINEAVKKKNRRRGRRRDSRNGLAAQLASVVW